MKKRRGLWGWRNEVIRRLLLPALFPTNPGSYIVEEEWDNLIILDACRYDAFKEVAIPWGLRGELSWRFSRGTDTTTFLRENFARFHSMKDTVYISANPMVSRFLNDNFFKLVPVWKGGWDENSGTVLPETTFKAAERSIGEYPGKRFVVHFLQPHAPFIGYRRFAGVQRQRPIHPLFIYTSRGARDWPTIGTEILSSLHRRNLSLALPYVERLLELLPGRTVVTSDHGEGTGDKLHPLIPIYVYEHPTKARIRAIVKVPWFVSDSPTKREAQHLGIEAGPTKIAPEDEETIRKRLADLGYL